MSALTSLLLRSHTAVTVGGQHPGRRADAVVRPWSVHTVAVLTVGRVLALIHICGTTGFTRISRYFSLSSYMDALRTHLLTCYCCHLTPLLVNVWSPGTVTVAVEGAFSVDALTVSTHGLIVALVHIWRWRYNHEEQHESVQTSANCSVFTNVNKAFFFTFCIQVLTNALKKVAVIVEALLTVALVARQRVLTVTLLTDFISEQRTLVDICRQGRRNTFSVTDGVNWGKCFLNVMRTVLVYDHKCGGRYLKSVA